MKSHGIKTDQTVFFSTLLLYFAFKLTFYAHLGPLHDESVAMSRALYSPRYGIVSSCYGIKTAYRPNMNIYLLYSGKSIID